MASEFYVIERKAFFTLKARVLHVFFFPSTVLGTHTRVHMHTHVQRVYLAPEFIDLEFT